jgi:hypothetical protein
LTQKPLDKKEKISKAHFKTSDYDPFTFISGIRPEVTIYDRILRDIGLLSLYTCEFTKDELERINAEIGDGEQADTPRNRCKA